MAKALLILGETGTGKTHSVQFLNPETTYMISPDEKEMPFRGVEKMYKIPEKKEGKYFLPSGNYIKTKSMKDIAGYIDIIANKSKKINCIVVDTLTHAMVKSVMSTLGVKGYDKFNDYAKELYDILDAVPKYRDDLLIIFTAHTIDEYDAEGIKRTSFKVPAGTLTKRVITPESLFTVVLSSGVFKSEDNTVVGYFETQNNGKNTSKSPQGMFPDYYIPNNMEYVRKCIMSYYSGEEMPELKEEEKVSLNKF